MSIHRAEIHWRRRTAGFSYPEYNREHQWRFEGGARIEASAAPAYLGMPECVDPEEAFVAAVASCHMLTFLAICARKRIMVREYRDQAVGYLEKNTAGNLAITHVELQPAIVFEESPPADSALAEIHRMAHAQCFIANSIRTDVTVGTPTQAGDAG